MVMHWLWFYMGLTNGNSWTYLLWSGIVGDAFIGGFLYRNIKGRNCHEHRCWRIGHPIIGSDGSTLLICRKHHPQIDHRQPFHFAEHHLFAHHFEKGAASASRR